MTYPKTPTLDKMLAIKEKSQVIGEFLEWLSCQNYTLAKWNDVDKLYPVRSSIEKLLAEYFNIDLKSAEEEKRKILETLKK